MINSTYVIKLAIMLSKLGDMRSFGEYVHEAGVHCKSVNVSYPKKNYYHVYNFGDVVYSGKKFPIEYQGKTGYIIQKQDLNFDERDKQRKRRFKRLNTARNNYAFDIINALHGVLTNSQVVHIYNTKLIENDNRIDDGLHAKITQALREYKELVELENVNFV